MKFWFFQKNLQIFTFVSCHFPEFSTGDLHVQRAFQLPDPHHGTVNDHLALRAVFQRRDIGFPGGKIPAFARLLVDSRAGHAVPPFQGDLQNLSIFLDPGLVRSGKHVRDPGGQLLHFLIIRGHSPFSEHFSGDARHGRNPGSGGSRLDPGRGMGQGFGCRRNDYIRRLHGLRHRFGRLLAADFPLFHNHQKPFTTKIAGRLIEGLPDLFSRVICDHKDRFILFHAQAGDKHLPGNLYEILHNDPYPLFFKSVSSETTRARSVLGSTTSFPVFSSNIRFIS